MRIIVLTKGYIATISARHFRRVNRHKWHVHFSKGTKRKPGQPYARATINGRKVYLHRFVKEKEIIDRLLYGCTDRESFWHVDHKNNQTLDCRDDNLKVCSHVENQKNRRNVKKIVDIAMGNQQSESLLETTNPNQKGIENANSYH